MDIKQVNDYAIKVLIERTPEAGVKGRVKLFKYLINNGLIDQQRLKKACVNHYYDLQVKECETNKDAVLDTAIEFDCSISFIHNVIYKFRDVVLSF